MVLARWLVLGARVLYRGIILGKDPDGNDMELTDMVLDHRGDLLVAGYLSSCDS